MEGQASDLAHSEVLVGDPNFSEIYLQNLRKVTPQDVQRVAGEYLTDNNLTITSLSPTGTAARVTAAAPAETGINIEKFELPNGLRLLVREDDKLPFVDFRAVLRGGVLAETEADNGITKLCARMLVKGTTSRTADQIAESIESVGGNIDTFAGNNSFGVSARVMDDDFDLGLDLLADVLEHPTFPADLMERERSVQLAEIKSEQDQVLRAGQQLLRETLFARHPYRFNVLGTPETVSKLTPAALAEFHRRYVEPGNMVLTVFGRVKADEVRRKVEAKFGALKSAKLDFPQIKPEQLTSSARREQAKPKQQAALLIGFSGIDMFSPDRFAFELLNEIYSGMGSRLFVRLRDELNLCYYCGSYQLLGLEPGYMAFYIGTTPQKIEQCEQEIRAEIERLKTAGVTEEELERAKNALIGQRKVGMQDNASLSMTVGLDELYGLGYKFFETMDARYRSVTRDDIRRVANSYLVGRPSAVAVIRPANEAN
jgi:zinc protease